MENKTKYGLILGLVLVLAGFSFMFYPVEQVNTEPYYHLEVADAPKDIGGRSVGVTLVIEHYRDGQLLGTTVKEGDYCLDNFGRFIMALFNGVVNDASTDIEMTENGGTDQTIVYNSVEINPQGSGANIYIGTGSTAVTLADYNLETPVYTSQVAGVSYASSGTQMNVTATTVTAMTGTATIREFGMSVEIRKDSGAFDDFFICRDVIGTGISVISGDVLTVSYIYHLN